MLGAVAAVAVFALAILAETQTSYWRSGETLWTHAIAVTGSNPEAELALGEAMLAAGHIDESEEHYRRGIQKGQHFEAINNFGLVLLKRGKLDEAEAVFRSGS